MRPQHYGTVGYQASDSTLPLLIGYYAVPVMSSAGMEAIVLIQMWYNTIATVLASFNHVRARPPLEPTTRVRMPLAHSRGLLLKSCARFITLE